MTNALRVFSGHLKVVVLETFRDLMALTGNIVIPLLCFVFFVLPNSQVVEDAHLATESTLQLVVMISMSTCLFGFSTSIAQDRQTGFANYLRTLPYGLFPRYIAHIVTVSLMMVVGIALLLGCALVTTEFELTRHFVAATGGLVASTVMFGLLGSFMGRILTTKSVVTVAQLLFLTLAFAGGILVSPSYMPERLNDLSLLLPSRAARDLIVDLGLGNNLASATLIGFGAWTAGFALLNTLAVRRKLS
ncbi:ABC transporter permease [Corynebacterium sp. ES2775-CONJ]|uniref:ABC transporter permease n=1 Tax=Corynebacterium sp. ES2775-CONJ TaxID=2974029 RepID=UPI0021699C20|nr:ABC transporter permease [Corynebacterium sp. ES2775-CONJ]MCS4489395.1 ABC transporter permease [Corynebacterium sp. ES2775-CONJ]